MSGQDRTPEGRFVPGQSGNPAGRPRGSRNRSTLELESLLEARVEELSTMLVSLSRFGNAAALRICFGRLAPPRKGRPVPFDLQQLTCHADAVEAAAGVVASVADGEITPQEAEDLIRVIESFERVRTAKSEPAAPAPADAARALRKTL